MKNCIVTVLLILTFSITVYAQNQPTERRPPPPITITPIERTEHPVEVSAFHVDSKIFGNLSQTEITISFFNPNNRTLSADFIFPIPENSTMNGYSLDIDGVMIDGVAVEKKKARVTFEKIVRQGIDPGLVEKVAGNVFKTRIFPLNSKQSRTIIIKFSTVLAKNNDAYAYQIPLMSGQLVKEFSIKVEAINLDAKPIFTDSQFDKLDFSKWHNAYMAEFKKSQFTIEKPITIKVPDLSGDTVIIGKNTNDEYWFSISQNLHENFFKKLKQDKKKQINKANLIWDASHSRRDANHETELKLLNEFFNQYQDLQVNLYVLRNKVKFVEKFKVSNGNWKDLKAHLKNIEYDGATNFSELNNINQYSDINLLFSDGLHTFAKKEKIKFQQPLFVFSSNLSNNTNFNQQLSEQNGGQSFHLTDQTGFEKTINSFTQARLQILSIEVLKGKIENLADFPKSVNLNNPQPLTGKLLSDEATLLIHYGQSGNIIESTKIVLNRNDVLETDLPEQIWAQQKLQSLQKDAEFNKYNIINLSQKYSLVSDFTSLIVLENLQQYVEHKIEPPKSLREMRQQYFAQITQSKKDKQEKESNKVEQVISMWQERKNWWDKEFPSKPAKRINKPQESFEDESDDRVVMNSAPILDFVANEEETEELGKQIPIGAPMRAPSSEVKSKKKENSANVASIKISEWNPDTPYLKALENTKKSSRENKYYQLKQDYLNSPAFYFDVANFFFKNEQQELGLQILSNIAELKIQDSRLLRTMAMKLREFNYLDLCIDTYRKVLEDRDEEPQSYRDLALVLAQRADQSDSTKEDLQQAIKLLYKVITESWDRFHGIEVTVLMEINQLIPRLQKHSIDYSFVDERLIQLLDVDMRIVLSWDSDMTDIDLWVIEPSGEKVTYSNTLSSVGGMFHQDFTGGYGPEEYLIKKAPKGEYTIKVHFYGNNSPELTGATTLYVDVITNFARGSQKSQTLSLRLDKADEDYLVGKISFGE